jgi:hypothetical protein
MLFDGFICLLCRSPPYNKIKSKFCKSAQKASTLCAGLFQTICAGVGLTQKTPIFVRSKLRNSSEVG